MDVAELLDEVGKHVTEEFQSMPSVIDSGEDLNVDDLPVTARRWHRLEEVVAVVADLRHSTSLGTGNQHAASTASIYEAAIQPAVRILIEFGAGDLAIQGDGVVGVFWGETRFERAFAAGATIKTFSSKHFTPQLETKWPDLAEIGTGFKIGIAASRILVKKIGIPRTSHQEEVWAGKAVNYAAKCAQAGDRHDLIVTGTVWDVLSGNDYISYTCSCGTGPSASLWVDVEVDNIPTAKEEHLGRKLTSQWCDIHGSEFCEAILSGETTRDDVAGLTKARVQGAARDALRMKAQRDRQRRRQLRGLR